ncbi:roadblock/LC7 domain-containing protein [Haloechinothrix salitolerans]|uniref:Roadblock/LC7 domain-containing protein n=1 Tax=Haloechinothrix salitolerans TaxID=926830 RepID=A0ABW2C582_9PSEU
MTVNLSPKESNWLLDDLLRRATGANRAVLLSSDGLLMGKSHDMSVADAEHLAAVASALQSLAKGTGKYFDGGAVHQTVVELERAFLVVTEAGTGACIAVLAQADADLGLIAYEVNRMVASVGKHMATAPRNPAADYARNSEAS